MYCPVYCGSVTANKQISLHDSLRCGRGCGGESPRDVMCRPNVCSSPVVNVKDG